MSIFLAMLLALQPSPPALTGSPSLRRPVALAWLADGTRLCVANARSGTVSILDVTGTPRVIGESAVGNSIVDLAASGSGPELLAIDGARHQLIRLLLKDDRLVVSERREVVRYPVSLQVTRDGTLCSVAGLWSRSLSLVRLDASQPDRTIELTFPPHAQRFVADDSRLVVADSFGGQIAVIEVATGTIESVRELPAHNIRGLALTRDGRQLLVSHQSLNSLARTEFGDVHWGNLMTNRLRIVNLETLLDPGRDLVAESRAHFLGNVGRGAGDPAGVAVGALGHVIVALAGVSEVAIGDAELRFQRQPAGRRPTVVLPDATGRRVYVAGTLSDSITVLELDGSAAPLEIRLGPGAELGAADRGELLFFDARLSHDSWFSCHSCHTDGHSNGRLNDNLGDGSYGAAKRVLSLGGVAGSGPWAWDGGMDTLAGQIVKSIATTMHGAPRNAQEIDDLAAFLGTLTPPPPWRNADRPSLAPGARLFAERGCDTCHAPPTFTSPRTYDVGLEDAVGNRRFNPPSLRGVGQRRALLHDGRAASLEAVLLEHRHQLEDPLSLEELTQLVQFLRSL